MRDPSPYAGTTVQLRADAVEVGGLPAEVVDWYENTGSHITWHEAYQQGDFRAQSYYNRRALAGLPDDDEVLLTRVDGMMRIIHVTEVAGYVPPPAPDGPSLVSDSEIGQPCPACQVPFAAGDQVAVLVLGPGGDPAARAACLAGQAYQGVAIELHWACRTGDTQYESAAVVPLPEA
jgi:hypothetical protein